MHNIMLSMWVAVLFCSKCHTQYSCPIPHTYHSYSIIAKLFVSYLGMFTSNSVMVFGIIYLLSVVGSLVALAMWKPVLQSRDELVSAYVIV
jgi:hypothetical protein